MMRQTTNIERKTDSLLASVARLKMATNGVVTKERALLANKAIGELKQHLFRIENELDAVLYQ
jgi:hypothetical protein